MPYYIFIGIGAFLMSLLGTRLTILALRHRPMLMDIPNSRSNHKTPVPRGGGIAVVMTIAIFLFLLDANYLLLAGLLLLAAVSLVDDWIRLSPLTRLMVQLLAVLLVLPDASFLWFSGVLPGWLDASLRVLLWLWFINLFNFMDGIDGIAAGEMSMVALGILVVAVLGGSFAGPLSLMSLVALAAGAGFLWWNWQPARIFLGDVGSIPIGYFLGYLLFSAGKQGYSSAALILPAYFVLDATATLIRRALRGEKVWEAHSSHYYQQAVRSGRSHREVVRLVLGVNLLLIMLAALATLYPEIAIFNVAVAYALCGVLLWFFARAKHKSAVA